jgi:hypothetical protein
MFHVPPAMVNAGLVQLPDCWTSGTNTVAGPTAAGVEVLDEPPETVVDVELPAAVVDVAVPAAAADAGVEPAVVLVAVPAAGGSFVSPLEAAPVPDAEPVSPLIHIPKTAATTIAVSNCQDFHERRSLILSSPFSGASPLDGGPTPVGGSMGIPVDEASGGATPGGRGDGAPC